MKWIGVVCAVGGLWSIGFDVSGAETNLPPRGVREIRSGVYQIGLVEVDAKEKRLTIPAQVNMVQEPVEYVLVSAIGKLHESIFKTEAEPTQIHAAALLLLPQAPSSNAPVNVRVWVDVLDGKRLSAESVVLDVAAQKAMTLGKWRYIGSRQNEGTFIAQRDGSIISIIGDPDALIESGTVPRENDENWQPLKANLPPVGTNVRIIIEFEQTTKP